MNNTQSFPVPVNSLVPVTVEWQGALFDETISETTIQNIRSVIPQSADYLSDSWGTFTIDVHAVISPAETCFDYCVRLVTGAHHWVFYVPTEKVTLRRVISCLRRFCDRDNEQMF